jgi:hypothetical protein
VVSPFLCFGALAKATFLGGIGISGGTLLNLRSGLLGFRIKTALVSGGTRSALIDGGALFALVRGDT